MAPTLVSTFASTGDADPVVIPLTGKTNGKDVFLLFGIGATPAAPPSPWIQLQSFLGGSGAYFIKLWQLPAADNTSAITSVTVDPNAARALSAVIWEDEVATTGTPYFGFVDRSMVLSTPAALGTGFHTFGTHDEVFAFFFGSCGGPTDTMGSFDFTSYDNSSFIEFADTGISQTTDKNRMWVAHANALPMVNDGVTAIGNGAYTGNLMRCCGGFIAYDTSVGADSLYAAEVISDTPYSYWRMGSPSNGNVGDEMGGLALTSPSPGPSSTPGAIIGDSDTAKLFSGTSGQSDLHIASYAAAGATGNPFTFEAWVWWDAYNSSDDDMLVEHNASWFINSGAFSIDMNNSSPSESGTISIGMNTAAAQHHRIIFPQSAMSAAAWHHLVVVFTPNPATASMNRIRVYVDSVAIESVTREDGITTASNLTTGTFSLMARSPTLLNGAGRLDEVAFYKSELSPARVAAHYMAGISGVGPNRIVAENANIGELFSNVAITGAGDATNQGFARPFSLNVGNTVNFACNGTGTVIDIYRIGWYSGTGWCKKATVTNTATSQPAPATISGSNGGTTCAGWSDTASWAVPADACPGLYVGLYRNVALNNGSWIPFVVRDDATPADIMYKFSDTTWGAAYNGYGTNADPFNGNGRSLYGFNGLGSIQDRTYAVTYNRPIVTRQNVSQTYWLACEAPLIRWLERNGYNVTYTASRDWRETAGAPTPADAKVYISSGHDEYWSQGMRDKWTALRDGGKHLLFMSGNESFWRIRFPDADTVWCYKDTMSGPTGSGHTAGTALDPVSWTGTWKDTRPANNATRAAENTITGTDFRMNGVVDRVMSMSSSDAPASHPFWRDTTVAASGITSGNGLIGFEADERMPTQPSSSYSYLAITGVDCTGVYADDNGENYGGTKNPMLWAIVAQRWPSGALSVGFGTCQWSWGLDATHDRGANIVDSRIQQATMNLLADLDSMPTTKQSALVLPTPVDLDAYGLLPSAGAVVPLASSAAVATGTLALRSPTKLGLQSGAASASGALALTVAGVVHVDLRLYVNVADAASLKTQIDERVVKLVLEENVNLKAVIDEVVNRHKVDVFERTNLSAVVSELLLSPTITAPIAQPLNVIVDDKPYIVVVDETH